MSKLRLDPHSDTAVAIARFIDAARAVRVRDWMRRSHIAATLARGGDGRLELLVDRHEERRAVDLLLTILLGLDIDHIPPEPGWQRALSAENALTGAALGIFVLVLGLIAWVIMPLVPLTLVVTGALLTFAVVAALPGAGGGPREYRRRLP